MKVFLSKICSILISWAFLGIVNANAWYYNNLNSIFISIGGYPSPASLYNPYYTNYSPYYGNDCVYGAPNFYGVPNCQYYPSSYYPNPFVGFFTAAAISAVGSPWYYNNHYYHNYYYHNNYWHNNYWYNKQWNNNHWKNDNWNKVNAKKVNSQRMLHNDFNHNAVFENRGGGRNFNNKYNVFHIKHQNINPHAAIFRHGNDNQHLYKMNSGGGMSHRGGA